MIRRYGLPVLAVVFLGLTIFHVVRAQATPGWIAPPIEPGRTPFASTVAATGIVEAETENLPIGSPLSGVVAAVLIKAGQRIEAGTVLFRLDDRQVQAELKVRQASLKAAQTQLARLESQ